MPWQAVARLGLGSLLRQRADVLVPRRQRGGPRPLLGEVRVPGVYPGLAVVLGHVGGLGGGDGQLELPLRLDRGGLVRGELGVERLLLAGQTVDRLGLHAWE